MPLSKVLSNSLSLTTLTASGAGSIQGLTVGRGAGSVATNTAVGASALAANTSGSNNVAVGYRALSSMTTGNTCVAVGQDALKVSVAGTENTAVGFQSMLSTLTASANSALGLNTLSNNTTGNNNTAVGYAALTANTTASNNTAVGYQAGYSNTTGAENVFVGQTAGYNNTTGTLNTFVGYNSGAQVTTGTKNSILGRYNGNQGSLDIRTASNYIVLSDGDGNPRIYWPDASPRSAGTWITTNVTPVTAASVASNPGTAAIWDGSGNLYKQSSSMRYKENIAEWNVTDAQLDAFVNLNPKLWDYIGKENGCAGFIAEDIEALGLKNAYNTSPLINYSNDGEPDSNRDFALIALQHKVIQRLEKSLQEQQALITTLTTRITALEQA